MSSKKTFGLIVLSAPSGAGKTTLSRRLIESFRGRLSLSISTTSRAPRGQETEGNEYFFVDANQFEEQIKKNAFAEWAQVHGNYYGTSKATLENFWGKGHHVLLDIDVQGASQLREVYPDRTLLIFIAPPSLEELERRLRFRNTDSEETIARRMKHAKIEMEKQADFDHVIVNEELEKSTLQLKNLIEAQMNLWEARGSAQ